MSEIYVVAMGNMFNINDNFEGLKLINCPFFQRLHEIKLLAFLKTQVIIAILQILFGVDSNNIH